MWNLSEVNDEIGLSLIWSLVTFSWESENCSSTHAWFNLNDFRANGHELRFSIALDNHSFKCDFFSASVVKFFKSAFRRNCQILEFLGHSSHKCVSSSFDSSNLITFFVKSNGKWIRGSEEPFENLETVALELISTSESNFFSWNSIFQEIMSILIINFLKFWS